MTRDYGTGTITEVKPGTSRLRIYVEDPISGKRRQVSKTIHHKTRPGKQWLAGQLAAFRKEVEQRRATGRKATMGRLCDDWLADLARVGRAKSTLETYRSHVETRIRPALGDVPLEKMDPTRVRAFMGSLGGSDRYARTTHAVLRGALAFAVANDWLPTNSPWRPGVA